MNEKQILEQITSCTECRECMEVCDTFLMTDNELQSPYGRVKTAEKVFTDQAISEDERFGLYTCTLCGLCNLVCDQELDISALIHQAKMKLANTPNGPYEIHNTISRGIIENDNSVNGDPKERLDWLPDGFKEREQFDAKESDKLLFLGCMSSFKVKESASSSYKILKKADYDFKILKEEPCCGEYLYSAGKLKEAKKNFNKVHQIFKDNDIKTLIVTCAGCLYAFNNVYPKYIDNFDIEVKHIIEIIEKVVADGELEVQPTEDTVFYHDACRMGRKIHNRDIYDAPRNVLKTIGVKIIELERNKAKSGCCGAGSGIRGVSKELCIDIGASILNKIGNDPLLTSCPLCVFNFRYVDYKNQLDKEIKYITDYLENYIE